MLIFADCGNIEQLRTMDQLGILSGVTTNPLILSREKTRPTETIANICSTFPDIPVFAQANALECDGLAESAAAYARISPRVVIKIPGRRLCCHRHPGGSPCRPRKTVPDHRMVLKALYGCRPSVNHSFYFSKTRRTVCTSLAKSSLSEPRLQTVGLS